MNRAAAAATVIGILGLLAGVVSFIWMHQWQFLVTGIAVLLACGWIAEELADGKPSE